MKRQIAGWVLVAYATIYLFYTLTYNPMELYYSWPALIPPVAGGLALIHWGRASRRANKEKSGES